MDRRYNNAHLNMSAYSKAAAQEWFFTRYQRFNSGIPPLRTMRITDNIHYSFQLIRETITVVETNSCFITVVETSNECYPRDSHCTGIKTLVPSKKTPLSWTASLHTPHTKLILIRTNIRYGSGLLLIYTVLPVGYCTYAL